eukprot:gnl/TRDRNA2_/TRDRNA2_42263_c0_seq1.p1 gnl/TRDRNA2_/TRDRNA2_42263_c0~~gnl/TRDRNA2_/TRDRNA2_42263_c0_seq1.p1  ORF type:complete len:321 (+),score=61.50 gnl/TRDRNA2_/TRDRNA2_42263_c0_seq1:62-1024(+)
MMPFIAIIVAAIAHGHAADHDAKVDKFADEFLVHKLEGRSLRRSDLDGTLLGKTGHLNIPVGKKPNPGVLQVPSGVRAIHPIQYTFAEHPQNVNMLGSQCNYARKRVKSMQASSAVEGSPDAIDTPEFDVIEKTKDAFQRLGYYGPIDPDLLDDDFVFRAPVVGPLNKQDYVDTMRKLAPHSGFPDLSPNAFGFTIDPKEPYKIWHFVRTTGTHTQQWDAGGIKFDATFKKVELPTESIHMLWTPEGKVKGLFPGYVVNKFEGNSGGLGAAFGLLYGIGQEGIINLISSPFVKQAEQLADSLGLGRPTRSKNLPSWYTEC